MKIVVFFPIVLMMFGMVPKKTPITESSYSSLQDSCNSACSIMMQDRDERYIAYCACGCSRVADNARMVVELEGLAYERQLNQHSKDVMPSKVQIEYCKGQSGL